MPNSDGIMTDIVPYIEPTLTQQIDFKAKEFPKSASFQFPGYSGVECQDLIIEALIASAATLGSEIRASKRRKVSKNRCFQIDLFCVRRKPYHGNCLKFNNQSIQANHTILQREHSKGSRKNKSRSSYQELVAPADGSEKSSINRKRKYRTTSKLPVDKGKYCSFGFTIFCSSIDFNWYLSCSEKKCSE